MSDKIVNLYGRVFIQGDIRIVTGLHIGAGKELLQIGGVDNAVVRDPLTNRPYIPGSSIRGKMRSLWEKITGVRQNFPIGKVKGKEVDIHVCLTAEAYKDCDVCPIYGVPGDKGFSNPTRLIVRDVHLGDEEAARLESDAHTDQPFTEVKYEAAIDRVTSAAVPRPMERVPADTVFTGFEAAFSIYEEKDLSRFLHVLQAMQLLEDDYLGGLGSRGSGKIRFENLSISCRSRNDYGKLLSWEWTPEGSNLTVQAILDKKQDLLKWLKENIPLEAYKAAAS